MQRPSGADDGELLRRIAEHDESAFCAFYERYAGKIAALLRRLCPDRAAAEDLLQEVFVAVWNKAASYRPERGKPAGWLYAIARYKVIDLRRRGVAVLPLETWDAAEQPKRELRATVAQAMGSLDRKEREALGMAYFGGYTYEESAARLELPLGTFKSRVRSGLRRLRVRLGEHR